MTDVFTQKEGLTANIAVPLLEDREGNIWVGTNLGLNRFRHNNIVVETGIPATSPAGFALAADNAGAIFVANPHSLVRAGTGALQVVSASLPEISSAYRDPEGTLWLGGPDGLHHFAGNRFVKTPLPAAAGNADVQAITADRSGTLWVSLDGKGIFRLDQGNWTRFDSLPPLTANAEATDAQGRIWFGYPESRATMLDGDSVRTWSSDDGLQTGHVMTISVGTQHLLFGGELGLARFEGDRFRSLTATRVPALIGISGIVEMPGGDLWLNASSGVVRIPAAQWQRARRSGSLTGLRAVRFPGRVAGHCTAGDAGTDSNCGLRRATLVRHQSRRGMDRSGAHSHERIATAGSDSLADRRRQDVPGGDEPAIAGTNHEPADSLHGAESVDPRARPLSLQAGRRGTGMAGRRPTP